MSLYSHSFESRWVSSYTDYLAPSTSTLRHYPSSSSDRHSVAHAPTFQTLPTHSATRHEPAWDLPRIREDAAVTYNDDVSPSAPPLPLEPTYQSLPEPQPTPGCSDDARQRLLVRLDIYGLVERFVKGDGNCQFRALSDQLYGTASYYRELRTIAMQQIQANPHRYKDFLESELSTYIDRMSKSGSWGDHITLQAIADYFGVTVRVLTSFPENCVLTVKPKQLKTTRVLWLSFWAEVHYNSLYPESEPPRGVKEKVLGSKRLAKFFHDDFHVLRD